MIDNLNIRDLQHFLYCKHRWGLIKIDNVWAENAFVIKANLQHENVHNNERVTYKNNSKTLNSVIIYNDELGIFGVTDSLVYEKGLYSIVEYKPNKPKNDEFNIEDALQVFAQKVCVDSIFNTNCSCFLYYVNQKSKIKLPFDKEYNFYYDKLREVIEEIEYYTNKNEIPKIERTQYCSGCSFKDLCMPLRLKKTDVKKEIYKELDGEI